jgi:hypothetical protein
MASFAGIAAAGKSIERLLNRTFDDEQPVPGKKTKAVLVRTTDFDPASVGTQIGSPALSIYFYRVDFNKTMRAAWSGVASQDGRPRLPLDVHFLISAWADNSEHELLILGRAMEGLEVTPILTGPLLQSSGEWASNEGLQIIQEEVSMEAVQRTFDSLPTDYRLSVAYVARVVRIDARQARPDIPVITLVTGKRPIPAL